MTHAALKDLLPCPFCGGTDLEVFGDRPNEAMLGGFNVCCRNPNCLSTCRHSGNREKAITAWNRRPALSAMEGEESEQSIKADAYDMVAEVLRERGLLDPGGSVVDTVRSLTAPPPQQAGCPRCASPSDDGCWHTCATHPTPSPGPQGGGEVEPFGWVYQHEETGHMSFCPNDGVNTPELFQRLNSRHVLCGPVYATPPAHQSEVMVPEGWMRDAAEVEGLANHLEQLAYRANERGDLDCHDQASAMAAEVLRKVLLPMLAAAPADAGEATQPERDGRGK